MHITIEHLQQVGLSAEQIVQIVRLYQLQPSKRLHGPCFVYLLFDPINRRPFYVGISRDPAECADRNEAYYLEHKLISTLPHLTNRNLSRQTYYGALT